MTKTKTKILLTTLTVATLAIGCGAFVACGGGDPEDPAGKTYEITFNANGGSYAEGAESVKLTTDKDGRLAAAPTADPTRAEYSFATYNTTADGSGSDVTYGVSGYQFKSDATVYAQWVEAGLYTSDGKFVAELEESTPGDSAQKQYGASGVELAPGDVLQIKIKGTTITHNVGTLELHLDSGCHGVVLDQSQATITVKPGNERAFNIYAKYYTDNTPCWSIYMTDGLKDEVIPGGAYLVGSGWETANWEIGAENYIDPENGLTVTLNADAMFKITDCLDVTEGENRGWAYNSPSFYKMAEGKEKGYLNLGSIGASDNGSVLAPGQYTITIEGAGEDIKFVFTPAASIKPNLQLTFVDGGFYLVGKGFKAKDANGGDKNADYKLIKEFYIDPDDGLEIICTKNNKIKLIASNADAPVWDVYSKDEYYTVVAPTAYAGQEDKYISFSGGEATVNTAGTYIVTIVVTDGTPAITFTPKGDFAPDESVTVYDYYIKGTMNNPGGSWEVGDKFVVDQENEGVYKMTIQLAAGVEFGFMVTNEGELGQVDWLGSNLTLQGEGASALTHPGNFKTVSAGTYTFTLDPANKTLAVSFTPASTPDPEPEPAPGPGTETENPAE